MTAAGREPRTRRFASGRRAPVVLALITWGYLAWWFLPIAVAVRASFSTTDAFLPRGFTTDWYRFVLQDHELRAIFLRTLRLAALTVAIATPLGGALALGLDRWRGRTSTYLTGTALIAVATPQIAIGAALFLVFAYVLTFVGLDARAQMIAHVTLAIPFVAIIVRVRLAQLGRRYEEMAMDLGAPPRSSLRRVVLPLTAPAIVAGAVVAFTLSFDNLVLSEAVCLRLESCRTVPMLMFGAVRGDAASPDIYAIATLALVVSLAGLAVVLGAVQLMRIRK
jgi:spermidine/putrescine transport system permease protein